MNKNGHIKISGTQITITGLEMITIEGTQILEN